MRGSNQQLPRPAYEGQSPPLQRKSAQFTTHHLPNRSSAQPRLSRSPRMHGEARSPNMGAHYHPYSDPMSARTSQQAHGSSAHASTQAHTMQQSQMYSPPPRHTTQGSYQQQGISAQTYRQQQAGFAAQQQAYVSPHMSQQQYIRTEHTSYPQQQYTRTEQTLYTQQPQQQAGMRFMQRQTSYPAEQQSFPTAQQQQAQFFDQRQGVFMQTQMQQQHTPQMQQNTAQMQQNTPQQRYTAQERQQGTGQYMPQAYEDTRPAY
eukprot:comp20903_c0_seq1/m.27832 comp20903_c0_seq1/g.27832  ORF comp20903_c0_seq1/g.27832 comp20903_c0_seq1/m.27832 type:complete len:261 (-) comp20903_c0_seq1:496-1278(-)